ncbi:MAG: electron transfer flavoprotein subunit beta/FixA family protein [Candidatus Cyclobacteriaceae bacterium M3_2C_046]
MKILVCITHVPDTTSKIAFKQENTALDLSNVQFIIGPYDDFALARAVELKQEHNGFVSVANVGTSESDATLRKALAIGADEAIRVDGHPADSWFVAKQLAQIIQKDEYDLIMMGRESADFNGGVVHAMVSELTGIPVVTPVMKLDVDRTKAFMEREIEGGIERVEAEMPLILGCQEPIAQWKIPNMRGIMTARSKPLKVMKPVEAADRGNHSVYFNLPEAKQEVKLIDKDQVEELVELLKKQAKVL